MFPYKIALEKDQIIICWAIWVKVELGQDWVSDLFLDLLRWTGDSLSLDQMGQVFTTILFLWA